jgi:acyl carrier protein
MNEEEIIGTLTTILQDLLANPSIALTTATVRNDVPGWDSFAYVNFIVAVEIQFGIRFRVADVESFQTVGDIVSEIVALTA